MNERLKEGAGQVSGACPERKRLWRTAARLKTPAPVMVSAATVRSVLSERPAVAKVGELDTNRSPALNPWRRRTPRRGRTGEEGATIQNLAPWARPVLHGNLTGFVLKLLSLRWRDVNF